MNTYIGVPVNREACDFVPVLSQLLVTRHAARVHDVDHRVLRANPNLVLVHTQHAVLRMTVNRK